MILYILDEDMLDLEIREEAFAYLGYMPACMFGPPEKCYYTEETNKPGLVVNSYGKGKKRVNAMVSWKAL